MQAQSRASGLAQGERWLKGSQPRMAPAIVKHARAQRQCQWLMIQRTGLELKLHDGKVAHSAEWPRCSWLEFRPIQFAPIQKLYW